MSRAGSRTAIALSSVALLLWVLFGLSTPVRAQAGIFTRALWQMQDGLPENIVQSIVQDSEGYLWVATTGGLTRFDGGRFLPYRPGSNHRPSVNSVFCLTSAPDGSVWAGLEGGGLLRIRNGQAEAIGLNEGLASTFVRSVAVDRNGLVWIGTDGGLFVFDGHQVRRSPLSGNGLHAAVHSIREDREGALWVGGADLYSIANGRRQDYTLPGKYSENRVKVVLQTSDGVRWIGTVSGLLRQSGATFERVPQIHATVRSLWQSSDKVLWIGTIGQGLWMYKDSRLVRVDTDGLLPTTTVLSIFEDRSHNLWIGTQDGLVRLERTSVHAIPLPADSDSDFGTISDDRDGGSWMVARGVYRISNNIARPYTFPQLHGISIRNLMRSRDGSLWIGTDGSGAYHLKGKVITHYAAPAQLPNNFIRGFLETTAGDVWIATDEGVARLSSNIDRKYGMADGLAHFSTRCVIEDRQHDIWIGTDQGLSHFHDNRFISDEATQALAQEKVWTILQDQQGALWFGTRDHGLFRWQAGKMTHFTVANGLVSDSIYQILEDRKSLLWLSGPDTISSLDLREIGKVPLAAGPLLSVHLYKMPFEAANAEMYGGRQPAGYVADDDSVWFATSLGAAHVVSQPSQAALPSVRVDGIVADAQQLTVAPNFRLSPGISRLTLSFAPLLLSSQEGLRFRYKLEGFDKDWSTASTLRSATYTNLPAGDYRFRVAVLDLADPDQTTDAEIAFSKDPHVYQRWWFLALCMLGAAGLVWSIYQQRVHQIRTGFESVLQERSRLAREIHDTVIQGCTSTSALLEALATIQGGEELPGGEVLSYARLQIRNTINEARDAVWDLRHEDKKQVDLAVSLELLAQQASRAFNIPVDCRLPDRLDSVGASVGYELVMIVREAFANAGLHAHAGHVVLDASGEQGSLCISISDDGNGFSVDNAPGASEGHFGLVGMRERLKRLGGTIQIESAPQKGTRITFRLPTDTSK